MQLNSNKTVFRYFVLFWYIFPQLVVGRILFQQMFSFSFGIFAQPAASVQINVINSNKKKEEFLFIAHTFLQRPNSKNTNILSDVSIEFFFCDNTLLCFTKHDKSTCLF